MPETICVILKNALSSKKHGNPGGEADKLWYKFLSIPPWQIILDFISK